MRLFTSLLVCLDLGRSTLVLNLGSRVSDVHGSLGHRRFRVCRGAELYDGLRRLVIPSCRKQDLALQHPKGYGSLGKRTWIWGTLGAFCHHKKLCESCSCARVISG